MYVADVKLNEGGSNYSTEASLSALTGSSVVVYLHHALSRPTRYLGDTSKMVLTEACFVYNHDFEQGELDAVGLV